MPDNLTRCSWADSSDNEDGFTIEASNNGGFTWNPVGTTGVNSTSYSVTGLTPGKSYSFRVSAFNSRDNVIDAIPRMKKAFAG